MLAGLMTKLKQARKPKTKSSARGKKGAAKKARPASKVPAKKPPKPAKPKGKAAKAAAKPAKKSARASSAKAVTKATREPAAARRASVRPAKAAKPDSAAKRFAAEVERIADKIVEKASAAASKLTGKGEKGGRAKPAKAKPVKAKPAKAKPAKAARKESKPARKESKPANGKPARAKKTASQLSLPLASSRAAKAAASDDSDSSDEAESSDEESEPPAPMAESARKIELKEALHAALEESLASARAAHHAALEGATHEEARPENDKDTRGLEQSYLARGHAQRVAELEAGLAALVEMSVLELPKDAPIALGAIVELDDADHLRSFHLAPAGGGLVLSGEITVLTPTSPIGRALLGRGVDDEFEVGSGAHARTLTIVSVA